MGAERWWVLLYPADVTPDRSSNITRVVATDTLWKTPEESCDPNNLLSGHICSCELCSGDHFWGLPKAGEEKRRCCRIQLQTLSFNEHDFLPICARPGSSLRAPFHIPTSNSFPLQPYLRKKIGFAVVTDNTKGAGRKIRETKESNGWDKSVPFMVSLIFFWMKTFSFFWTPTRTHHKLVISYEFTCV